MWGLRKRSIFFVSVEQQPRHGRLPTWIVLIEHSELSLQRQEIWREMGDIFGRGSCKKSDMHTLIKFSKLKMFLSLALRAMPEMKLPEGLFSLAKRAVL